MAHPSTTHDNKLKIMQEAIAPDDSTINNNVIVQLILHLKLSIELKTHTTSSLLKVHPSLLMHKVIVIAMHNFITAISQIKFNNVVLTINL